MTHTIHLPERVWDDIQAIANATNRDTLTAIADCVHTYVWLLNHQTAGREIVALEASDFACLENATNLTGDREALVRLVES